MSTIKLIHISITNVVTKIATFYNLNEAQCSRDLLQAKCSDQDNCYYFIEYYNKERKTTTRQGADSFARQIRFMHPGVQTNIKIMLS